MPEDWKLPVDMAGYDPATGVAYPTTPAPDFIDINSVLGELFGVGGHTRYQTWPERLVRSATTLPGDVASGKEAVVDPETGRTSENLIHRAGDLATFAAGGSFAAVKPGQASLMSGMNKMAPKSEAVPTFYSVLENTVKNAKMEKGTPDQWIGYLKNNGIKNEELEFTLGELPSGQITKKQLEETIASNKVQVNDVWKGEYVPEKVNEKQYYEDLEKNAKHMYNESYDSLNSTQQNHVRSETFYKQGINPTKYHGYQLPGGENYRELLMTTPHTPRDMVKPSDKASAKYLDEWNNLVKQNKEIRPLVDDYARRLSGPEWEKAKLDLQSINKKMDELHDKMVDDTIAESNGRLGGTPFHTNHWDEPNVLAHVRMNDRNIPDVGKSLHVEEIQSDWHQKGRKQGYKENGKFESLNNDLEKARTNLSNVMEQIIKENNIPSAHDAISQNLSHEERANLVEKRRNLYENNSKYVESLEQVKKLEKETANAAAGVPNAPFKKTWDELALKRVLREAAEKNYDAISWTPGEAQAARYDLSKHLENLKAYKNEDGTFNVYGQKLGHKDFEPLKNNIAANELEAVVGKELAQKIIEKDKNTKSYEPITKLPEGYSLIHSAHGKSRGEEWGILPPNQAHAQSYTGRYHPTEEEAIKAALGRMNGEKKHIFDQDRITFKNVDLKVGGEGMKAFYDKMLVDKANSLVKKYGGKVEKKEIPKITEKDTHNLLSNKQPVHVIKLTPELKKAALEKGFSLFSAGVPIFSPVDYDPFKSKYKLTPVEGNPFDANK